MPMTAINIKIIKRKILKSMLSCHGVEKIETVLGMTYANQPWKAIGAFKKIISLGFATGTYVSIFSTPWQIIFLKAPIAFHG